MFYFNPQTNPTKEGKLMRNIIKFFCVFMFSFNAFAGDPINQFMSLHNKKEAIVDWVMTQSAKKVTQEQAQVIVTKAMTQSVSQDVDLKLILAIIRNESRFVHNAQSSYGAKGLMQVVPKWHHDKLKGRNPKAIDVNIAVGTQILQDCFKLKKGNFTQALSCYTGYSTKTVGKYQKNVLTAINSLTEHIKINDAVSFGNNYAKLQSFE
jgi:soluble lytic murein transglycosylase-like protein